MNTLGELNILSLKLTGKSTIAKFEKDWETSSRRKGGIWLAHET